VIEYSRYYGFTLVVVFLVAISLVVDCFRVCLIVCNSVAIFICCFKDTCGLFVGGCFVLFRFACVLVVALSLFGVVLVLCCLFVYFVLGELVC